MKKSICCLLLLGLTSQPLLAAGIYTEGSLGYSSVNDITEQTSGINFITDNGTAKGIEVGVHSFEQHNVLRLAASWQRVDVDLDRIEVDGITFPVEDIIDFLDIEDPDLTLKSDLYSLNLHYDFPSSNRWRFSAGLGVTLINISGVDSEVGYSIIGSARYMITDKFSLGIKAHTTRSADLRTRDGLEYNKFNPVSLSATASIYF